MEENANDESMRGSSDLEGNSAESSSPQRNNLYADVNAPNDYGTVPLHTAILRNDMELLETLLSDWNIDVNYKTYKGETPLMASLCSFRDDPFVLRLIKAECDTNAPNKFNQSPLHIAMLRNTTNVAYELIKNGADVNAQDNAQRTPVFYAIDNNSVEGVYILLYYGADVSVLCEDNITPFTFALYMNRLDIAEILLHYYDEFCDSDYDGYTALHLATGATSPLAIDLVKTGADVNCVTNYGDCALIFSLKYENAELFKLIWSRLDHEILLSCEKPFLLTYIDTLCFSATEWVECLYLILKSPVAFQLVDHYKDYMNKSNTPGIFYILLHNFNHLEIEFKDRITLINVFLSLYVEVYLHDIDRAFELYGFNEELEILIYALNRDYVKKRDPLNCFSLPMLTFILAIDDNPIDEILKSIYNVLESDVTEGNIQNIINVLGYFAIPQYKKQHLQSVWHLNNISNDYISKKFKKIPEIPSLLELSRNQAHKFIKTINKKKQPYHFHDAIKWMYLPQLLKDILRFKKPIY